MSQKSWPKWLRGWARVAPIRPLGQGAFSEVWLAYERSLGVNVALKAEPLGWGKNIRETLLHLRHRNLVSVYDIVDRVEHSILILSFVDGPTWASLVSIEQPSPGNHQALALGQRISEDTTFYPHMLERLKKIWPLFCSLYDGVQALHSCCLVHGDIHPDNIILSSGGPVITDFGLMSTADSRPGLANPAFMAPEQADGPITKEADLYSLGVLLFQSVTGQVPFVGGADEVLLKKNTILAPRLRSLCQEIPKSLDDFCAALLSKDPHQRQQIAPPNLMTG